MAKLHITQEETHAFDVEMGEKECPDDWDEAFIGPDEKYYSTFRQYVECEHEKAINEGRCEIERWLIDVEKS